MEKKFDATLKSLLEDSPADWPILAGVSNPKVAVIDADIATISGAADKVLRIQGPAPWIMHFEFQSGPDSSLPRRMNMYNGALEDRHDLPVASVAVLLCRQANLATLSGIYQRQVPLFPEPYRVFRYQVIRVWELPVESLLQGGLGRLALAPISAVNEEDLPAVLKAMKRRLDRVQDRARIGRLWTAVYVLMGLRYEQSFVDQLLQGVLGMKESTTYQGIVAEGRSEGRLEGRVEGALEEIRKFLLELGRDQFGVPVPAKLKTQLEALQDLKQLEKLALQVPRSSSWDDLLAGVRKSPRRKKNHD